MKKIIALLCAVLLSVSLVVPAFATDGTTAPTAVTNKDGITYTVFSSAIESWNDYTYHIVSYETTYDRCVIYLFNTWAQYGSVNIQLGSDDLQVLYCTGEETYIRYTDRAKTIRVMDVRWSDVTVYNETGGYTYLSDTDIYYTITFETGFDDLTIDSQTTANFILPELSYDGYEFDGWYFDEAYTMPYSAGYQFTEDTTLYAKWIDPEPVYTISFVTGFDDLVVDSQYSSGFVAPELTYGDYEFDGWYFDEAYTMPYSVGYEFTEDTTLYAKWIAPEPVYTITYNTGFNDLVIDSETSEAVTAPLLSYDGYIFLGWYLDTEYATAYNSGYEFTEDTTLYAKWVSTSSGEAGSMLFFAGSVFDSLTEILDSAPIFYLVSLMGLVLIIGIIKVFVTSRI